MTASRPISVIATHAAATQKQTSASVYPKAARYDAEASHTHTLSSCNSYTTITSVPCSGITRTGLRRLFRGKLSSQLRRAVSTFLSKSGGGAPRAQVDRTRAENFEIQADCHRRHHHHHLARYRNRPHDAQTSGKVRPQCESFPGRAVRHSSRLTAPIPLAFPLSLCNKALVATEFATRRNSCAIEAKVKVWQIFSIVWMLSLLKR